jgi:PhnB protein
MTQPIPPGRSGIIPHLVINDAAAALEFYKTAFGAVELFRMPTPDGRLMHAEMKLGDAIFMLADDFPEYCEGASRSAKTLGGTPVGLHRYVEDCDAAVKRATDAGATILMPPQDMFWGDRYAVVIDPFGHQWSLATHIADPTPEELAAAGAACFEGNG